MARDDDDAMLPSLSALLESDVMRRTLLYATDSRLLTARAFATMLHHTQDIDAMWRTGDIEAAVPRPLLSWMRSC